MYSSEILPRGCQMKLGRQQKCMHKNVNTGISGNGMPVSWWLHLVLSMYLLATFKDEIWLEVWLNLCNSDHVNRGLYWLCQTPWNKFNQSLKFKWGNVKLLATWMPENSKGSVGSLKSLIGIQGACGFANLTGSSLNQSSLGCRLRDSMVKNSV